MAEELKIVISADVEQARAGLNSVSEASERTATNIGKIGVAANSTATGLNSISTSATKIASTVGSANTALANTGKTAAATVPAVDQLQTGVSELGDTLETLRAKSLAAQQFIFVDKDVNNIARLNQQIEALEKEILRVKNIGKTGFDLAGNRIQPIPPAVPASVDRLNQSLAKIPNTTNQGTLALINFGRVIQDAPFGILGMANNINPLVESLQRLSATAKATGTSVGTQLLGALKGGGGLGLAISAITSAVTFAAIGFTFFNRNVAGSKKNLDETKKAADDLKESIAGIFGQSAKEATEVGSLIALLNSEAESRERKLAAIKKLNEIAPENFKNIKLEGEAVIGLNTAYDAYLAQIQTVLAVKIKQAQVEQLIEQLLRKQGVTLVGTEKALAEGTKRLQESLIKIGNVTGVFNPLVESIQSARADEEKETNKIKEDIRGLFKDIQELSKGIKLKIDIDDNNKAGDKIIKIIELAKKIQSEFSALVPGDFKIFDLEDLKVQFEKAKDIIAEFRRGFGTQQELRFKLVPQISELDFSNLEVDVPEITLPKVEIKVLSPDFKIDKLGENLRAAVLKEISPEQFAKDVKGLFQRFQLILPFKLILDLETAILNGDEAKKNAILAIADLNQAILDAASNLTAGLGDAIGEAFGTALAGGDLNAIFKDFGELVGEQVEELGKLLVKLGVQQQLAITALATANPLLEIAAGIALIAIGAALKNTFGRGIQAREKGGPVEKGKPYIVGEKGYELFIPQQSGTIISHDKVVQSQSVKEYDKVREYFASRQIAESIKAIETRLTNVVYKISEQSDRTSKALVERFTTHSDAINKFVQTSITATNDRTIEAIRYISKDKSGSSKEVLSSYKLLVSDSIKNVLDSKDRTFNKSYFDKVNSTLNKVVNNDKSKDISDSYIKLINDTVNSVYKEFYGEISHDELKKIISNNSFEKNISPTVAEFVEKATSKTDKITEIFSNYKEFYSTITNQLKEFKSSSDTTRESNLFANIIKDTKESYSSSINSLVERITNNSDKQTITSKLETITSTLKSFTDKFKISVTNNIFGSEKLSVEKLHTMFKIPKFEFGGLAFGPTLGILGEGFGISRSNPEVVAPLNQLKGILGGEFALNVNMNGRFDLGSGLLLQVNRAMKTNLRTTGRTGL